MSYLETLATVFVVFAIPRAAWASYINYLMHVKLYKHNNTLKAQNRGLKQEIDWRQRDIKDLRALVERTTNERDTLSKLSYRTPAPKKKATKKCSKK